MLELIRRVGREFGISIVISTHLMGDVERTCDSVVVLDAGRLLRTGAVSGLHRGDRDARGRAARGSRRGRRGARPRAGSTSGSTASLLTLDGVSGDDYDAIRDAIVDADALLYRLAPGTAHARRRLRACGRAAPRTRRRQ